MYRAHTYTYRTFRVTKQVRSPLILVKKSYLQPSAALVQRIIARSLRLGSQSFFENGDYNDYFKIDHWQKFKDEVQFAHFLGYERQSPKNSGYSEENFHIAHALRHAGLGAIALPAAVMFHGNLTSPPSPHHHGTLTSSPSSPHHQEQLLEKQESSSVHKRTCLPIREHPSAGAVHQTADAAKASVSDNIPRSQKALASEVEKVPPLSTSKRWFREATYSSLPNLPSHLRSEQYADREREIFQVIGDVDRLCSVLDTATLQDERTYTAPTDSGPKENSDGSSTQTSGSQSRNLSKREGEQTANLGKPRQNKRKNERDNNNNGEESEGESSSRKKTKASEPKQPTKCSIYIYETNTPGRLPYNYLTKCDGRTFGTFRSMVEHVLRIHIQPFQCELCTSRFGRKSELTRHISQSCLKKGLVPRLSGDPNNIPEYVIDIGHKISRCTRSDQLDRELYYSQEKTKKYDFLDGTDHVKKTINQNMPKDSTSQSHLGTGITRVFKEVLKYPNPQQPTLSTASREVSESRTSIVGLYALGGVDIGEHASRTLDHTRSLQNLPPNQNQTNGYSGKSLVLDPDDDLARDLIYMDSSTNTPEIEKIIRGRDDATKDLKLYKKLMSEFLVDLPPHLSEELVSHIHKHPRYTNKPPKTPDLPRPQVIEPPCEYAKAVAADNDDIPIPTELRTCSDSAYGSNPSQEHTKSFLVDPDINNIHTEFDDMNNFEKIWALLGMGDPASGVGDPAQL